MSALDIHRQKQREQLEKLEKRCQELKTEIEASNELSDQSYKPLENVKFDSTVEAEYKNRRMSILNRNASKVEVSTSDSDLSKIRSQQYWSDSGDEADIPYLRESAPLAPNRFDTPVVLHPSASSLMFESTPPGSPPSSPPGSPLASPRASPPSFPTSSSSAYGSFDPSMRLGSEPSAYGSFDPSMSPAPTPPEQSAYGLFDFPDSPACSLPSTLNLMESFTPVSSPSPPDETAPEDPFPYPSSLTTPPDAKVSSEDSFKYDWNHRFQNAWKRISEQRAKSIDSIPIGDLISANTELLRLSQDFVHSARTYGKIIISEVYLDVEHKTIKPKNLGGVAGGQKYIVQNILFKFAVDSLGLFGSNLLAAKVAGHELKGATAYFSLNMPDVFTPLMALVDYRGFRLICMAVLPLGHSSLIYGTEDGGQTLFASDRRFNKRMLAASKLLKLKPHLCGLRPDHLQNLCSAADVEGHRGTDGKFYLLDFSRTLPPVSPNKALRNGHLYQLFRKEFVQQNPVPLCSDAYSSFILHDPAARTHNAEVVDATNRLLNEKIPRVAKELHLIIMEAESQGVLSKVNITHEFHKAAINIRYIGILYSILSSTGPQAQNTLRLLLIEALARDLKNRLRIRLQETMKALRVPLEVPYRQLVVDFFNLTFSSGNASREFLASSSARLIKYFQFSPSISEVLSELSGREIFFKHPSLPSFNGRWLLFKLMRRMLGLRFTLSSVNKFKGYGGWNSYQPLDILDLIEIGERVKHMNIVDAAEGMFFYHRGLQYAATAKEEFAVEMFTQSVRKFDLALRPSPLDRDLLLSGALAHFRLLQSQGKLINARAGIARIRSTTAPSSSDVSDPGSALQIYFNSRAKLAISADHYFLMCMNPAAPNAYILCEYANFLVASQRYERAEEFFLRALEANPAYSAALLQYGNFLIRRGETVAGNALIYQAAERRIDPASKAKTDAKQAMNRHPLRVYLVDNTYKTIQASTTTTVADLKKDVIRSLLARVANQQVYEANQVLALEKIYETYDIYEEDEVTRVQRIMSLELIPWFILQRPGNRSCLRFRHNLETKDPVVVSATLNWGFSNLWELLMHLDSLQHSASVLTCFPGGNEDSLSHAFKIQFFPATVLDILSGSIKAVRDTLNVMISSPGTRWSRALKCPKKISSLEYLTTHFLHLNTLAHCLFGVCYGNCSCMIAGEPALDTFNRSALKLHNELQTNFLAFFAASLHQKSLKKIVVNTIMDGWLPLVDLLAHIRAHHWEPLSALQCDNAFIFTCLYLHTVLVELSGLSKSSITSMFSSFELTKWMELFKVLP